MRCRKFDKKSSSHPLYIQLYAHLREWLNTREARRAGKLPTELELCKIFSLSRNTVGQALKMLEEEQLICRIKNRGTFLTSAITEFDPQSIRRTIGVVFPHNHTWEDVVEAIRKNCLKLGYELRLYTYNWMDPDEELKVLHLATRQTAGVILYPGGHAQDVEEIRRLTASFPLVLFDLYAPGFECNSVATDHYLGAYRLAETVIRSGCRKPCILAARQKISSPRLRLAGFRQALEDHGLSFQEQFLETPESSANALERFFKNGDYDSILDTTLCQYPRFLREKEIVIARFDDFSPEEQKLYRTISAIQRKEELGNAAINLLRETLRSGNTPEKRILIAPEIIPYKKG
ncbi:MAG: GntR family transcriptional regulator [Lentisphaeria bacterium]|nr:GntR family transcriptional regulator [Lentisphaeria bacterium]